MVNINSSFRHPLNGAVVLPPIASTPEQREHRLSVQALRSATKDPPRPEIGLRPDDLAAADSEDLIREILRRVGEDPDREGLQETPARIVRSWKEIYGGYRQRPEDVLVTQFQAEQYDEMVLLRDIEFYSTCEHHMLPFYGKAHIGYLPNQKIVGLSKLARPLDVYARRLQVQERLTYQIAAELQRVLHPKGVAVNRSEAPMRVLPGNPEARRQHGYLLHARRIQGEARDASRIPGARKRLISTLYVACHSTAVCV